MSSYTTAIFLNYWINVNADSLMRVQLLRPGKHDASSAPDTRLHPIEVRIKEAKAVFADLMEKQSRSLTEARSEYKRRYKRPPPPGFDQWHDAAREANATIVDNFDTIMNAFEPYFGYTAQECRALTQMAVDTKDLIIKYSIRNGSVSVSQFDGYERYTDEIGLWMQPLLQKGLLPDMDFAYSAEDEPRVVVPYDLLERQKKHCPKKEDVKFQKNMVIGRPTNFLEVNRQNIRDIATSSCPLNSSARALDPPTAKNDGPLQFISSMQSICNTPPAATQHGYFSSPVRNRYTPLLLPIFSKAKPRNYQDLHMPSPFYTELYRQNRYNATLDPPWSEKANRLYWTGRPTGGYNHHRNWRQLHRHRFVQNINDPNREITLLHQNNATETWDSHTTTMSTLSDQISVAFTIKWRGSCDPSDCDWTEANLPFFDSTLPEFEAYKSRFLMDLDGYGFTERFYRFLGSKSTVFKMSMFEEWHDDRLVPWVHYVPVSVGMDELPEMIRFFSTERGQGLAREIAEQGQE